MAKKPKDLFVTMAKVRRYVKEEHGMNTSGEITDALSLAVQTILDSAAGEAEAEGLKTVKARHLPDLDELI